MPLNLIFITPGNYTIEDNGIPGDNISVIKDGNGTVIFTFGHPADALGFTCSTPGVHITINITDSLGAANLTLGDLTNPGASFDSITMRSVSTTGTVTLVSNGFIREGGSDSAADITAGAIILSAGTGIGTGANSIETRTGLFEAETNTGGIAISNIGSVQIGGIAADVDGLDVATSGNINFTTRGSIFLTEANTVTAAEVVHGGSTSGNVTIHAIGTNSDIIGNVDNGAVTVPRGSVTLTAGRDIQLGTIGADFNNDVISSNALTFNAGRDILIDGFADILADNFGLDTGGNLMFNAGRNIGILNLAGTSASVTASGSGGGDAIFTTGIGGSVTVNGPGSFALGSTSGNVVVNSDRILIDAASGISAPSGSVTIRPVTPGWETILGSVSDVAFGLELSDIEAGRIFAQTLTLGGVNSGAINAIGAFSPTGVQNLRLLSGADVFLGSALTVNAELILRAADNVHFLGGSTTNTGSLSIFVDDAQEDGNTGGILTSGGSFNSGPVTIDGNLNADVLRGIEGVAQIVHGLGGNDTIFSSGEGSYFGDEGNETIFAGLSSGLFDENLDGGLGTDTLDTTSFTGIYQINLGTGVTNFGFESFLNFENLRTGDGGDTIVGTSGVNVIDTGNGNDDVNARQGNDIVNGGGGNDTLRGKEGGDTLSGGVDNDILDGGLGRDFLTGGVGLDTFEFRNGDTAATGGTADVIEDFVQGQDLIDLLIDANTGVAGNQNFAFIDTAAFSGAAGELRYFQQNGRTFIQGDVNGDGAVDFAINMAGTINLAAGDFIL